MLDTAKVQHFVDLSPDEIGESEENVKINFIVPFLECLGHSRLEFEYKYKDIILRRGVHKNCRVIVETKSYGKKLDSELAQLKRYCDEERPLLGVITNGEEIRVYSYFWRRITFEETLLYLADRKDLCNSKILEGLVRILSKENLESGRSKVYVDERKKEIEIDEERIVGIEESGIDEEDRLKSKIAEVDDQVENLDRQRDDL